MIRETWVRRNGRMVLKQSAEPRGSGRVSNVISDDIGSDLEHMAYSDGRRTSSKSVFRRWTKEAGCVEKGNDRETPRPVAMHDIRADVAQAIEMVKHGHRPSLRYMEGD